MTEDLMMLGTWKYEFDNAVITTVDGIAEIPKQNITALYIEKDFDKSFLPLTKITMVLTQSVLFSIRKSYDSATIKIGVKKFRSSDDQEQVSTNRILMNYFNATFEIYESEMTPFLNKDIVEREQAEMRETGIENKRPEDDSCPINLYLVCKNHSTYYRKLTNNILRGVTMTDVIAYTLGNVGVPTSVLMTPLDNTKKYPEFWVLPYNLLGMLKFLHKEEGLYKTGYRVFQDYNMLYILDRSIGTRKVFLDPKEITKTKIDMMRTAEDINIYHGCFTFEDKYFFINCVQMPTVLDLNIDNKDLAFTAFHAVDEFKSGSTLVNADAKTYENKKSFKVISNRRANSYSNSSLKHIIEEQNKVVQCVLEEVDLDMIKPYFQYELVFEKQFGGALTGMYRLSCQQLIFTRIGDCVDAKTICHFISK